MSKDCFFNNFDQIAEQIATVIQQAQQQIVTTVNTAMVYTYFEIGRIIVEEQQKGDSRAQYGAGLLKGLAERLTNRFGKGFSYTNLEQMRKFFKVYSIPQTASEDLVSTPHFNLPCSLFETNAY